VSQSLSDYNKQFYSTHPAIFVFLKTILEQQSVNYIKIKMISTHPQDLQIFPVKRLPFNRISRKKRCTGKKRKVPSVFTQVCQIWMRKCPPSLKRKCLSHLQVEKRKCPSPTHLCKNRGNFSLFTCAPLFTWYSIKR
jgi:hypothetical protein